MSSQYWIADDQDEPNTSKNQSMWDCFHLLSPLDFLSRAFETSTIRDVLCVLMMSDDDEQVCGQSRAPN